MATATEAKLCVKCKTDVTRAKRMKDSGGQYWCVGCGTEDSKKKHTSKIVCADCRGTYSPTEVQTAGADVVCNNCLTARGRHANATTPTATQEADSDARVRRVKLAVASATVLGGVTLITLYALEFIG